MKAEFELPGPVVKSIREIAQQRGIPTDALVADALRAFIGDGDRYMLPDHAVSGRGLRPEFAAHWTAIRDAAYGLPA